MFVRTKFAIMALMTIVGPRIAVAGVTDTDGDGVPDDVDVCCGTPIGVPVDLYGRPVADADLDCDVDLDDFDTFWDSFTGFQGPCLVDECQVGTHDCDPNATCTDLPDGFECTCNDGFVGDGFTCTDIDECADENPCAPFGDCVNDPGAYHCDCDPGFWEEDGTCVDIDECAGTNPCGVHGDCVNEEGSYHCNCASGYEDQGGVCVDINECSASGICGVHSICSNLPGTYECRCSPGHANCDGMTGCEVDMGESVNTCETAEYIGEVCGDAASGFGCPATDWFSFATLQGRGEKWFRVTLAECSTCCASLNLLLTKQGLCSTNYDLKVYRGCASGPFDQGSNSACLIDQIQIVEPDICVGSDDTRDFWIRVTYANDGSASCDSWTLDVKGLE